MAEQTFRSPGFFDQEVDLTQRENPPLGTPAGVIGTAEKGPAFVPVTVGSFADFQSKFGGLNSKRFGPYAVREFLKNRDAVTYVRVLGAGSNASVGDINRTRAQGSVKNAGFSLASTAVAANIQPLGHMGTVQFLTAKHVVSASEAFGYPVFTDNSTIGNTDANLVRAVLFTTNDARLGVLNHNGTGATIKTSFNEFATVGGASTVLKDEFKIFVSSSAGSSYGNDDSIPGARIFTASLNPRSINYVRNVLNTDPDRFVAEKHLLYAAFDVEPELATVARASNSVAMLSGSGHSSNDNPASQAFRVAFGRLDTRYQTPRTTEFISQPFGDTEFDLFHFETLSDGAYGNTKFKVSIKAVRGSSDPAQERGTFTVQVRAYGDSDFAPQVLEEYPGCNLNPTSETYVARMIGDMKAFFNFDADDPDERRVMVQGKFPNKSKYVRIVMHSNVVDDIAPATSLPFGFRGLPALKTNDLNSDQQPNKGQARLAGYSGTDALTGSVVPPVPLTFKATRGAVSTTAGLVGKSGATETVDSRIYFGVKTTALAATGTVGNANLNSNVGTTVNRGLKDQLSFLGIKKMDNLHTGSGADNFNDNKFTLARVALPNQAGGSSTGIYNDTELSGTVAEHMLDAAYIRNGNPDSAQYTITVGSDLSNRITFGTLLAQTSSVSFNRFTDFMKFTNVFYGGYDGVNVMDKNARRLNDKSISLDTGGGAASGYVPSGFAGNQNGIGKDNSGVRSYQAAADIMTDPFAVNTNILAIPGIRESFVTDHAMSKNKDYGMSIYLLDIPQFDDSDNRIYDDASERPSVSKTAIQFEGRRIDNNTAAAYFPDVVIEDDLNNERIKVPPSVAAIAALGFNDAVSFPWFAPAGFNRGSLEFVKNTGVRLTAGDRDTLYDSRVNPIANFPQQGFVIFGQKTLQAAQSALDRVNVRRLMLEVKRAVSDVANRILFEQNTPATRARFISQVTPILATIQAQSGIENFKVVMDDTNNTTDDVLSNRLNGKIVLVPTRAIEFISLDFVITNSGVSFE